MILTLPKEYWWDKLKNMLCGTGQRGRQIAIAAVMPVPRTLRTSQPATRIVPVNNSLTLTLTPQDNRNNRVQKFDIK